MADILVLLQTNKGFEDITQGVYLPKHRKNSVFVKSTTAVNGESDDVSDRSVCAQALSQIAIEILLPEESPWNR